MSSQWSAHNRIGTVKRTAIILRADYRCTWCGSYCYPHDRHVDHLRPRHEGGTNDVRNLVLACSDCNLGRQRGALPRKALRRGRTWTDVRASIRAQQRIDIAPGSAVWRAALLLARAWHPEQFARRQRARAAYLARQASCVPFGAAP